MYRQDESREVVGKGWVIYPGDKVSIPLMVLVLLPSVLDLVLYSTKSSNSTIRVSQRLATGVYVIVTSFLSFHMGRVLHTTPHLPMNHERSNPSGPSDSDGWVELGLCSNCTGLAKLIGLIADNGWQKYRTAWIYKESYSSN